MTGKWGQAMGQSTFPGTTHSSGSPEHTHLAKDGRPGLPRHGSHICQLNSKSQGPETA